MGRKKTKKKSFSNNLELLFQERMMDDNAQDTLPLIETVEPTPTPQKTKNTTSKSKKGNSKTKSKTKRKSFSDNLERFFKDSLEGVLDGVVDGKVTDVKRSIVNKGNRKAIGLDLLIQRTTEHVPEPEVRKTNTATKRVTVVLDSEKLDELKRIAKEEKRRLHQIIGDLVNEYLDNAKQ
jgi:glycyl-tRNA synthetase beta subunit